ncbi:MAG: sodium:alanine symporter family protein [Clostridia bacterium]|nr:sodium:alanine symporter family protein [Clostridia bacterium]
MRAIEWLNTYIFGPALPIVIFGAGLFLMIRYGSFIFTKLSVIIKALTRKNDGQGISPFNTAMLALASTLGVGNIVGVSTAIYSGGPGAVFWMTLSAVIAMPLKYGEVVLAVKHRVKEGKEYRGGAMYYMQYRMKSKAMGCIFAVLCIINAITVGNIVQINAASESFQNVFSASPLVFGIIASVFIFISIYKGTNRVSSITSFLIPIVTVCYIMLSLVILFLNIGRMGEIVSLIISEAFSFKAATGGIMGYAIVRAMRYGVARGIMSNEAGSGTSPIAHAKSNLKSPVEQGFWGIFEVFADTVVMCNLTAFVILLSFEDLVIGKGLNGMSLVIASYGKYIGNTAAYIIAISVMLFAYATVICQGFYGGECVYYLTKNERVMKLYRLLFSVAVIYGAVANTSFMWTVTDLNISLMTVINTVCICIASGDIKRITDRYFLANKKFVLSGHRPR